VSQPAAPEELRAGKMKNIALPPRAPKRDIIMIAKSSLYVRVYIHTHTQTNLHPVAIPSDSFPLPRRAYRFPPLVVVGRWVPFYFNFFVLFRRRTLGGPAGGTAVDRPTSSASTLRLISEMLAPRPPTIRIHPPSVRFHVHTHTHTQSTNASRGFRVYTLLFFILYIYICTYVRL